MWSLWKIQSATWTIVSVDADTKKWLVRLERVEEGDSIGVC